ncbi:TPA: hypothetical protein ACTPRR_001444, partial [Salmonella enterica]
EAVQRVSRGTKTSLSFWGMVALGGLLCLADPRYRRRKPLPEAG